MKSTFQFPLARLLALRERREDAAGKTLKEARSAESALSGAQAAAAAERAEARAALLPAPGEARPVAYLRNVALLVEHLDQRLTTLGDQLVLAERETARLHTALVGCVRDRKVMERLRDRHLAEWRVESDRRERADMDAARPLPAMATNDTPADA